ncbi:AAA family ATPase [Alcaligenes sp. SDU_A2]|uniref:AAA family ATPase n=1 Tax=Alcaligenes sp. SDU_A2 TaxID=3136634 RepID=UPI00311F5E20
MLKELHLQQVGPANEMRLKLKPRLNLITGDNGLGKSFLLDIAWWAMTRRWPHTLNKSLVSGYVARPESAKEGSIAFTVQGKAGKEISYTSTFSTRDEAWTGKAGRPHNPGLVLYAMADGGFAVWDPARNYWKKVGNQDVQDRVPAYAFSPRDVWDGLKDPERGQLCNGLINDWAGWQKENGQAYEQLCAVLEKLSETESQPLKPGPLTRISLDDARDIPTLQTAYGKNVSVLHASSGVRRIIALAYLLVWSWQEHRKAAELLGEDTTPQVVFLIDEIEAHLHPRWQRVIVSALLNVTQALAKEAKVQLIVATHSPLVMVSAEPSFNAKEDAWWDLDLEEGKVVLRQREFEKHGDADRWLTSEAFDLRSSRPLEYENLLKDASALLEADTPDIQQIQAMNEKLHEALSPTDDFLFNWRYVIKTKGWLK